MTRTGSHKTVPDDFWQGRLASARSFHEAARTLFTLAAPGDNANPTIAQIVNAAIAYADAVTARRAKLINQRDHQAIGALLRRALGNRVPARMIAIVEAIVAQKDEASYGARPGSRARAESLLERLDELAIWAEAELRR